MLITTEATESKTFRLSSRLSVTITAGESQFFVEWLGARESLTRKELARYRAARDEMAKKLSARIGRVVIVEPC